jgi:predicted DNA-binding transcriptional regulator AlpA
MNTKCNRCNSGSDGVDRLLNQTEVAAMLSLSPRTLEYYRAKGLGPKFRKIGKLARYALSDVQAYIEQLAVK